MATEVIPFNFILLFFRRNCLQNKEELATWRNAAIVVVLLASSVFFAQHFGGRFFDPVFEICIFYVPASASVILYLYQRRRL
jgi:hypothetical protein